VVTVSLLRRIARRCETHDRYSYTKTRQLEQDLGMEPSTPPDSFTDQHANPDLVDCGNTWCQHRR
jgi:hypothetical protein